MRPIGPYEIAEEAGQGAAGAVYQGLDSVANKRVSLWLIDVGRWRATRPDRSVEQLLVNLQALRDLSHPNIAATYDILQQEDRVVAVTDFVSGISLAEILSGTHKVAIEDLLTPLREVAQALDYAHRRGIVHGALRPEHILLPQQMCPEDVSAKISGFLLAAAIGPEESSTQEHMRILGYCSPEVMAGVPADERTDQFSFGVIVYELISGEKPFMGATKEALSQGILQAQPRPVQEVNLELTETVGKVLGRALSKSGNDRFASVSDFFGALSIALGESQHLPDESTGAAQDALDEEPLGISPAIVRGDEPARGERSSATAKRLGLVVVLCFVFAAVLMFIVRMNSGTTIPVQVIETHSAPAAPALENRRIQTTSSATIAANRSTESANKPQPELHTHAGEKTPQNRPAENTRPGEETTTTTGSTADVDITSDPPGARIAVDGRSDAVCHAPCTMTLPVGRHTLAAQLDGYGIAQRIFTAPDANGIYIQMAQSYGILVLTSAPTNAAIQVDGKNYGATPATLRLSAGTHRITLLSGNLKHEEAINVQADSMQSRNVRW